MKLFQVYHIKENEEYRVYYNQKPAGSSFQFFMFIVIYNGKSLGKSKVEWSLPLDGGRDDKLPIAENIPSPVAERFITMVFENIVTNH
jgi:hypothetical protein